MMNPCDMWELIAANKRKSVLLFSLMGVCLLILGYVLGEVWAPGDGWAGALLAAGAWLILSWISYTQGGTILLQITGAWEVSSDLHPQLVNIVEEMRIAANLSSSPRIFIMDELTPNAFATGRDPDHSAIIVTTGLLMKLNRDELQGVIAHEMSHIIHRDVLFVTFAGIMLGVISLISDTFFRSFATGLSPVPDVPAVDPAMDKLWYY